MPTDAQQKEMHRVAMYFPFRLTFGALNEGTGEFVVSSVPTMRTPNKLVRQGWKVWMV